MPVEKKSGLGELQVHMGLETGPVSLLLAGESCLKVKGNYESSAPLRMNITPVQTDVSPGVILMYTPSGQPWRRLALPRGWSQHREVRG